MRLTERETGSIASENGRLSRRFGAGGGRTQVHDHAVRDTYSACAKGGKHDPK
jgi:hypothetical protein